MQWLGADATQVRERVRAGTGLREHGGVGTGASGGAGAGLWEHGGAGTRASGCVLACLRACGRAVCGFAGLRAVAQLGHEK